MSGRTKLIIGVIAALLVLNLVGAAISIAAGWPAEFDGVGDPDNVWGEFLSRGTLLAAPLLTLVLIAASVLLIIQGGKLVAGAGLVGLIILAVLIIVGSLGEPLSPEASDPPVAFLVAWRAVMILLATTLALFSSYELRDRLRA